MQGAMHSFRRHAAFFHHHWHVARPVRQWTQLHRNCRCYSSATSSRTIFSNWLSWYSLKLETNPLVTKGITAGLIAALGDFSCQVLIGSPTEQDEKLNEEEEEVPAVVQGGNDNMDSNNTNKNILSFWDPLRTLRFGFLGTVFVAPIIHYWYGALATQILPGNTVRIILQRVALDQFIFTPLFLPLWLVSLWTLEDYPPPAPPQHNTAATSNNTATCSTRLQDSMPTMLVANWGLWIPAQAINFRYVPTKYQVLYSNIVGLVWNTYLSFATRRKAKE